MDIHTAMTSPQWVPDILSQITSHELGELVLDFAPAFGGSQWIHHYDWAGVAHILTGSKFANLRSLYVDCRWRICSPHNVNYVVERRIIPETEEALRSGALSGLYRRGVLQFIHTDAWMPAGMK